MRNVEESCGTKTTWDETSNEPCDDWHESRPHRPYRQHDPLLFLYLAEIKAQLLGSARARNGAETHLPTDQELVATLQSPGFAASLSPTSNPRLLVNELAGNTTVKHLAKRLDQYALPALRRTVARLVKDHYVLGRPFSQSAFLMAIAVAVKDNDSPLASEYLEELSGLESTVEFGAPARVAREVIRERQRKVVTGREDDRE